MKLGILGGAFNPIHNGHLKAAEEIQKIFLFDKLLIIPSSKPPFRKQGLISAKHRYEMIKIAVKDKPAFCVSDIEIKSKRPSYSVETIKKLSHKYKNAELFFIIGIDAFLDFPKWKDPFRIMELANLVIISRPGFSFLNLLSSPYLTAVNKKTLRELAKGKRTLISINLSGFMKAYLCRISGLDISASDIRSRIKAGKSVKYLLPDSVESYIISHKLYK